MLNFFKKAFSKNKQVSEDYKPKLKSFSFATYMFINYFLDKEGLYSNFPKDQQKDLKKLFNDGLVSLKKISFSSSSAKKKAAQLKINNMFSILIKYNPDNKVDIKKITKN